MYDADVDVDVDASIWMYKHDFYTNANEIVLCDIRDRKIAVNESLCLRALCILMDGTRLLPKTMLACVMQRNAMLCCANQSVGMCARADWFFQSVFNPLHPV